MKKEKIEELLVAAVKASLKAGEDILGVYNSDFSVEHKDDKSPLTMADQKAHNTIVAELIDTKLPVLSEEGKSIPFEERKDWSHFWMVDPLDGTKEFVKRNGEFTVNIALIENGYPIAGVIYVPVHKQLYAAALKVGSYFVQNPTSVESFQNIIASGEKLPINIDRTFSIVGSRSHMSPETETFIAEQEAKQGKVEIVSMGSSLKLCLIAHGKADLYPRFAPTMEWDTAAGQAIAEAAGKSVINWETKERMQYNKENLLNSWFLVS